MTKTQLALAVAGPSPRVRGSRPHEDRERHRRGSIPACAGKPLSGAAFRGACGVHPRVCGEAITAAILSLVVRGPSPRVRGSRCRRGSRGRLTRSIPACAGKPLRGAFLQSRDAVHPRVCGEALPLRRPAPRRPGPSPRVRGSHHGEAARRRGARSIPACAGKPLRRPRLDRLGLVHPRVCGEAIGGLLGMLEVRGPSPRVRGSHRETRRRRGRPGSIPACAGKPSAPMMRSATARVHPRVCGEAPSCCRSSPRAEGPSPRVRGSPSPWLSAPASQGSIPACAGKPPAARPRLPPARVHPRVCGEAQPAAGTPRRHGGPSPRVRGSRPRASGRPQRGRSIPACAGKPHVPCGA